MKWVRKERKEALPVVDASLQNPQPECVTSSQLTFLSSIVYLVKTPEKCRSVVLHLQKLLLHNQRMKTFAIQRPNRDLGPSPLPQLQK